MRSPNARPIHILFTLTVSSWNCPEIIWKVSIWSVSSLVSMLITRPKHTSTCNSPCLVVAEKWYSLTCKKNTLRRMRSIPPNFMYDSLILNFDTWWVYLWFMRILLRSWLYAINVPLSNDDDSVITVIFEISFAHGCASNTNLQELVHLDR